MTDFRPKESVRKLPGHVGEKLESSILKSAGRLCVYGPALSLTPVGHLRLGAEILTL